MKVTIAGAGAGGFACIAYFTMQGHDATLFNRSEETIKPIIEKGGVEVFGNPALSNMDGFIEVPRSKITTDLKKAVEGAEIILNPVPSTGYSYYVERLSKLLEDGQILYTFGKGGSALANAKTLKDLGFSKKVYLGDCNTLCFGVSKMGGQGYPGHTIRIEAPINRFLVGGFPAQDTDHIMDALKQLFPTFDLRRAANSLDTLLVDYNAITHTPPMICNAGRIDSEDHSFHLFGRDALTRAVLNIVDAIDKERRALADKLDIPNNSLAEEIRLVGWNPRFGVYGKDISEETLPLWEAIHTEFLEICEGPYSLNVRHLTEDIPHGLLTFASLGDMLEVPTPISKAVATIASTLLQRDFSKEARTVKELGIKPEWSIPQVKNFLETGKP